LAFKRFDVYVVPLDPTVGAEMRKTRPCVIISPDDMNDHLRTVIVTPLTSTLTEFRMRVRCDFQGVSGEIALDHVRTVDKRRLRKRLGRLDPQAQSALLRGLAAMFAP
jgi:mRNA interferase MazF